MVSGTVLLGIVGARAKNINSADVPRFWLSIVVRRIKYRLEFIYAYCLLCGVLPISNVKKSECLSRINYVHDTFFFISFQPVLPKNIWVQFSFIKKMEFVIFHR